MCFILKILVIHEIMNRFDKGIILLTVKVLELLDLTVTKFKPTVLLCSFDHD